MLEHVAKLMGRMRRVTFLADRGFRSREWARVAIPVGAFLLVVYYVVLFLL